MAERVGKKKQGQTLFPFTISRYKMYLHFSIPQGLSYTVQIKAGSLWAKYFYLFIIGKHVSGLCECGSSETVKHIFLECRKYRTERRILFDRLLGVEAFSVFSLFGHSKAILQFLNTGLYVKIQFTIGPVEGSNTLNSVYTDRIL